MSSYVLVQEQQQPNKNNKKQWLPTFTRVCMYKPQWPHHQWPNYKCGKCNAHHRPRVQALDYHGVRFAIIGCMFRFGVHRFHSRVFRIRVTYKIQKWQLYRFWYRCEIMVLTVARDISSFEIKELHERLWLWNDGTSVQNLAVPIQCSQCYSSVESQDFSTGKSK